MSMAGEAELLRKYWNTVLAWPPAQAAHRAALDLDYGALCTALELLLLPDECVPDGLY